MVEQGFSRRGFLEGASAASAAAALAGGATVASARSGDKPNIVFITTDEHKFNVLGCAGNPHAHTPNLDGLAARGAYFPNTYSQGPLCQPARASIITGAYVKQHGQTWNRANMNPGWPTMMKQLQQAGYTTAVVGKTHFSGEQSPGKADLDLRALTPWCKQFGLDYLLEEFDHVVHRHPGVITPYLVHLQQKGLLETYRAEVPTSVEGLGQTSRMAEQDQLSSFVGDGAIDWLRTYKSEKPYFLWTSFIEPHPPFTTSEPWVDFYKDTPIQTGTRKLPDMPDNAWGRYLKAWVAETRSAQITDESALRMARYYYGLVSQVDKKVGELLKAVDETSNGRETWVIFTADHGEMLGEHDLLFKDVFYKGSVLVPNIIVPPGGTRARRSDALVQAIDITATILDIAGTSLPTSPGRSILPLVHGHGKGREVVYSELAGLNDRGNYFVMAATPQYRYVYDKLNKIPCELFDLKADPDEMNNLAQEPSHAGIMNDLHKDYVVPFMAA